MLPRTLVAAVAGLVSGAGPSGSYKENIMYLERVPTVDTFLYRGHRTRKHTDSTFVGATIPISSISTYTFIMRVRSGEVTLKRAKL